MPRRRQPSTGTPTRPVPPPSGTPSAVLTEAEARARLAAGKTLPLAWLWLLAGEKIKDEKTPGKTLIVRIVTHD